MNIDRTSTPRLAAFLAAIALFGCTTDGAAVQLDVTFLYPSDAQRGRTAASHAWVILAPEGSEPCSDLLSGAADPLDATFMVLANVAATPPELDVASAQVPLESVVVYAEAVDFRGDAHLAGCTTAQLTAQVNAVSVELRPVGVVDCGAAGVEDGALCDDGDECTVDDTCSAGTCIGGRPRDCSSVAGECTIGRCVTGSGCVPEPSPDGAPCDDGLTCSTGDACRSGACTGGDRSMCCPGPDCVEYDCDNGLDEDDDFRVDCDDSDCDADPACRVPEDCDNGFDDDGDGLADCDDPDCASLPVCVGCMPTCPDADLGTATGSNVYSGSTASSCDRRSPSCASTSTAPDLTLSWRAPRAGTFRFDTFGSSFDTVLAVLSSCTGSTLDCHDGPTTSEVELTLTASQSVVILIDGSGSASGTFRLNIEEVITSEAGRCADGVDNDGDGPSDCADPDCFGDSACGEVCDDSLDNDADGRTDCMDLDCLGHATCDELEMCDNSTDDDGDGDVDCSDSECAGCAAACTGGNCWDVDLGVGPTSTSSSTVGRCNRYAGSCNASSSVAGDRAFRWVADATGTFTITATSGSFTPVIYARVASATCDGSSLGCGSGSVSVPVLMDEEILIVVDGDGEDEGAFTLSITGP